MTGAWVKDRRQQRGLTQAQVAAKIGVTRAAVAQWETGRTQPHALRWAALERLLARQPRQVR